MLICNKLGELKKIFSLFLIVLILSFTQCAKKGRPSGGPKDVDAPLFVTANPPYESINFDKDEIDIYFDEYIKLKNLNDQLIISPPLNPANPSLISPQGTPSKNINIKILDTLLENTTYIFDFGSSIEDNNESNKLERFKYVFSTGSYIDSLTLSGSVKNAFRSDDIKNIKLLLYRLDSSYTDSAVYNKKPDYVTSSLDTSNYQFSNLRKGKYLLVALNDVRSDYFFDPAVDEIGFLNDTIFLPRDTLVNRSVPVFKEELPYQFKRAKELRKGQLFFGYQGKPKNLIIETLSEVPENFSTVTFKEKDKDTLNLWHTPIEKDSLVFKIMNEEIIDTVVVKLRKKKLDSLIVSQINAAILEFKDTMFFGANNPIIKLDTSKIEFVDADTIKIPYTSFISKKESKVGFVFEKKFEKNYRLNLYPEAFTDIFEYTNDTIISQFRTRSLDDYGEISLSIQNPAAVPLIIQLIDTKDKKVAQKTTSLSEIITFDYLLPKTYKIRIIHDTNNNGKWDTGDYLKKRQPETVEFFPKTLELRANFSLNEILKIESQ